MSLYSFPTLESLSAASEDALRDLGLGYRARYIVETPGRAAWDSS